MIGDAVGARGELFVFLDADTRLGDGGLRRLIETQFVRGGFVSAVLYPFTLLFFIVIFVRSLQLTWLKQTVRWKGRDITV